MSVQQAPPAPAQASGPGVHVVRDLVYRFFDVTAAWLAELPPSPGVDMLSGALLLVRRTLFNQAPIVTPVQTTGQAGGPISGRVGAVDPENDPMTYELVQTPLYGDVIVNDDGTYLYTPGADFNGSDVFVVAATDTGRHINLVDLLRPTRTTAVADVDQGPDQNLIEFEFRYGPGSALWSQEALTALRWTAAALSTYFVITTPVTITLDIRGIWVPVKVNPDGTKEGSVLAGASSPLISEDPGFHYTIAQNKIITGIDVNGPAADARVRFNFAHNWAYGDEVAKDQWDFESTAKHELLHAFGFASNTLKAGSNIYPDWGTFDQFLVTKDNVAVIRNYQWDSTYDPNLTGGTTNGLYFAGPNAVAAYGRPVPLYTPTKWLGGSSVSHLDDDTFKDTSGPNVEQLMNSASAAGPGVRILSDIEIAMMRDIGFTMV